MWRIRRLVQFQLRLLARLVEFAGFFGAIVFAILSLAASLALTLGVAISLEAVSDVAGPLSFAIILSIPWVLVSAPALFWATFVGAEYLWRWCGPYHLLGVKGTPVQDSFWTNVSGR